MLLLAMAVPSVMAEAALSEDVVILYTNDVHAYIDQGLSYDVLAALKADLQTKYEHVLLLDAGDHMQGTAYGSMDKGESIIKLMNAAGYDLATLGNHEFDYLPKGLASMLNAAVKSGDRLPQIVDSNYLPPAKDSDSMETPSSTSSGET